MAVRNNLKTIARRLAEWHSEAEPNIREILLFPDKSGEEIRLVEIDPTAMPKEDRITPFYFAPEAPDVPKWLAVAMIVPEDKGRLRLPDGWGTWNEAETIWRRRENNANGGGLVAVRRIPCS